MATSLATIVLITAYNTLRFQHQRQIYWRVVAYIASFAMFFSFLAGYAAHYLPDALLIAFFLLFVLTILYKTLRRNEPSGFTRREGRNVSLKLSALIGAVSGIVAGLTGVGGGAVTTPLLLAYSDLPGKTVVPVSNAVMFFTASAATLGFAIQDAAGGSPWQAGYVHFDIAFLLFVSALPAAFWGTRFQRKITPAWRRGLLIVVLLLIAARMIFELA